MMIVLIERGMENCENDIRIEADCQRAYPKQHDNAMIKISPSAANLRKLQTIISQCGRNIDARKRIQGKKRRHHYHGQHTFLEFR